jgi:glyoxylase-like metal-dependent hydrolase (beta-lactamase superfamily II)
MDGITPGIGEAKIVCHCLLIETNNGLVLIDSGLGLNDIKYPQKRINPAFRKLLFRPALRPEETAYEQIIAMGFDPRDVRHIVLTHLDFDHAGGIDDFPWAEVHVMKAEREASLHRDTPIAKARYSPLQLTHEMDWNVYRHEGEKWFGFEAVRDLKGLPPEILFVPLVGHTWGHAGIAIDTDEGWLLHAGDAYFFRGEMDKEYHCTPGMRGYQKMMEVDRKQRLYNQSRLRQLVDSHSDEVTVFSAHDPMEYLALKEGILRNLRADLIRPGVVLDDIPVY